MYIRYHISFETNVSNVIYVAGVYYHSSRIYNINPENISIPLKYNRQKSDFTTDKKEIVTVRMLIFTHLSRLVNRE